jgi:hypothetical protein
MLFEAMDGTLASTHLGLSGLIELALLLPR